ncbi:MAG: VWA domain-containing protein [Planctomycetota bacterium]
MMGWAVSDWDVRWIHPWALAWLALAIPIFVVWHLRSLADLPLWQRRLSLFLRSLVGLLLIAALSGLTWMSKQTAQSWIVLVDQSDSIDDSGRQFIDQWCDDAVAAIDQSDKDIELSFLPFSSHPGELQNAWPAEESAAVSGDAPAEGLVDEQENAQDPKDTESEAANAVAPGTDLAEAIAKATAGLPPNRVPRLILLSDGLDTRESFKDLRADQTTTDMDYSLPPIDTIPIPDRSEPEIQVAAVRGPTIVRQGQPFYVEVEVQSTGEATAILDFFRGDIRIGETKQKPVKIVAGKNSFRIRQTITSERQVEFSARISPEVDQADTWIDNNSASTVIAASGKPRVLMIEADVKQADEFRFAMQQQKIDIEVRPPDGVPTSLSELQAFECVIFSNVPATELSMRQMDLIRTYVQDLGGGFIMLGGDQSFGLGGYYRTALEEILPVRSNFEKEREKPSLAMVLVIDKSGSMGGSKIQLAQEAAIASVELLGSRDSIGVIAFDGDAYWVSDLQSASNQNGIIDDISSIQAGGGTNLYPGMSKAFEALQTANAKFKHAILMTDGQTQPGDFEGLAAEMSAAKMTVSTVALGAGASEALLEDIASIGGGRYYFCDDASSVPQVFAKETIEASQSAINELPFLPQLVRPTTVLSGIDWELSPLLLGYVVTRPKPTSEFILATESGDPLLVWWRYGLGMTVAFTSDVKERWSPEWLAWPEFGSFWAQLIRHAMRKEDRRGLVWNTRTGANGVHIEVDAVDSQSRFVTGRPPELSWIDGSSNQVSYTLNEVSPGRYETKLPIPDRGSYQMSLVQQRPDVTLRQSRGLVVGYPDEYRIAPTDRKFLSNLAESTGGRCDPSPEELVVDDERTARDPIALWPYLLLSALGVFIADVAIRRRSWAWT